MNTSIFAVVLTGALLSGQNGAPTWHNDYSKAQQQGIAQQKPLVVVFAPGAKAWTKVVRDANPSADVAKMLADKYVCVCVDTATPAGKKLAADFAINGKVGMVISDRAGTSQAFWHQGDMPNHSMAQYLQKFADPSVVIRTTENGSTGARTSFYPSTEAEANWGTAGSSYCPSCNNARSRR